MNEGGMHIPSTMPNAAEAAYAAAYAAARRTGPAALVALLVGLIDEYDRLTSRTGTREVTDAELRTLAERVGQ